MNPPLENPDLCRWLDGEMSAAESARFQARLDADPALQADAQALRRLSYDLRAHLPPELPVPHADFFNSQIQVRLQQEENALPRDRAAGWWSAWRLPSFATALAVAAAVVVAGVMIWQQEEEADGPASVVLSSYTPDPAVQARSFHSAEAQATVLLLEGLDPMPADRNLVSFQIEQSSRDDGLATTFYGKRGEVVLVLSEDSQHQPRLLTAR